jgi:hypothetical protein
MTALRESDPVGENATSTEHVPPVGIVAPATHVELDWLGKSWGFEPETETLEIISGAPPMLVNTTVEELLVEPTSCPAKVTEVGLN